MSYGERIHTTLATLGKEHLEPRLVEAFMRNEHATLDHLTPARWKDAVRVAAVCVEADERLARKLAEALGL